MERDINSSAEQQRKNYNLKSKAVDDLVSDADETPEYSAEELNRYRRSKKFRIPPLFWVLFWKAWFAGAVCYFVLWGLALYIPGLIEMMFVLCVTLGLVTDLLLNNVLRFIEKLPGENSKWMFIPYEGMKGLFLNLLYAFLIVFCVYTLYDALNRVVMFFTGNHDVIYLGVEPILFGMFCMGFDMLFIGAKRLLASIIRDAKNAA